MGADGNRRPHSAFLISMTPYGDRYETPARTIGGLSRRFPSWAFFARFHWVIVKAHNRCLRGVYDNTAWYGSSEEITRALEAVGGRLSIENLSAVEKTNGPAVIVANHMSTLETVVLPHVLLGIRPLAIVAKKSLAQYPVFGRILRTVPSIIVGRESPREDLRTMLEEGSKHLQAGRNFLVFPQRSRSQTFDPEAFNSIGVKLARRNRVPIIPLALKTDIWQQGRLIKDIGPIDISHTAHFSFGQAMEISGNGREQHQVCVDFIQSHLQLWGVATVNPAAAAHMT